ncbi:hypothetical protein EMPS_10232 [Entomortierella parvispora]|uniref:Uncharacterized protein n=1 Tax=Entomortierella parvispora TaxID=205924 RepID=A0A9P3M124_9FUNG|nr:hypothetical protein EMPS_10232 [Entomortierella parvispora]
MNQDLLNGALPLLSNIVGNNTAAGLMTVLSLAVNTVVMTTSALSQLATSTSSGKDHDQHFQQSTYGDQQGSGQFAFSNNDDTDNDLKQRAFQSMILSAVATLFSTLNSTFQSMTHAETPLTTYIFLALFSYLVFKIVYGFVAWIVRSVLNLIKVSIMITVLTTVLWFIFNITSSGPSDSELDPLAGDGQYRPKQQHKDPISQILGNLQTKFKAEYQRQQEYLQNPHVY